MSDPTRVQMLEQIIESGEAGCAEFDERVELSKSTISYHTKILNAAGLIDSHRDGRVFFDPWSEWSSESCRTRSAA